MIGEGPRVAGETREGMRFIINQNAQSIFEDLGIPTEGVFYDVKKTRPGSPYEFQFVDAGTEAGTLTPIPDPTDPDSPGRHNGAARPAPAGENGLVECAHHRPRDGEEEA